ncbi:MAG TPA: AGE family epimerase/isomerase [Dinghuibacter sp.]|uniref:AGE family epimerase/isomerase n=1 Tax=Dinghuibacter sp. TaxID=2024697 RepID=UPI002B6A35A3|nr:AGE family epimerase/isomerase [Dinghuibacter sp.]HTJ10664.1 AGE family epimerase/isomerase [Dinghuibacter sp.]
MTIDLYAKALQSILDFWSTRAVDPEGGFYGRITSDNRVEPGAPKGSVLNARILWTFSAAYRYDPQKAYLAAARRAYNFISSYFIDRENGGVYWSVASDGRPLDTKKQIYALAFALYGLSEYHAATGDPEALREAIGLYRDIEAHSLDSVSHGYWEAFSRDWQPLSDVRLSLRDVNEQKTMNTHLHVLEAYTNLYRVWPDIGLREQIDKLLGIFLDHIIDPATHHLVLFFDEAWHSRSDTISYGHDIEASWLLPEAAHAIGSREEEVCATGLLLAEAASEGLAPDGSLWYEYEPVKDHWRLEKHWWVQAEAMVGFLNAWRVSGDDRWKARFERVWTFIDAHIVDRVGGEWWWGVLADNTPMPDEDKAGIWKCPYHNGRALLEVIQRLVG